MHNIERGLPSVTGTMIVMDPKTGMVNAMLDGTYLTQLRTGAVQGVATDILARKRCQNWRIDRYWCQAENNWKR